MFIVVKRRHYFPMYFTLHWAETRGADTVPWTLRRDLAHPMTQKCAHDCMGFYRARGVQCWIEAVK